MTQTTLIGVTKIGAPPWILSPPSHYCWTLPKCPKCVCCGYFAWGSYLHNTNIWGHFWSKTGYLAPCGAHIWSYPHCYAIHFEEIPSYLSWMHIYGYFALSNGQNREVLRIISILGVILVKMWVFDTPGCPCIWLPPLFCNLEDIPWCIVLKVFLWLLCIIK